MCEEIRESQSWLQLFNRFDANHDGYIATVDLSRYVRGSVHSFGLNPQEADMLLTNVDRSGDHLVDFPEFCTMMSRAKSLRLRHVMFRAAQMVLPRNKRIAHFNYLQHYDCFPPPIFMLLISIVEIAVYAYYVIESDKGIRLNKPVPMNSPLIFNPNKRYEIWRYVSYMFIHIGIYHLFFNVATQIMLGVPLELVHKLWRVALVYLSGVVGGSLMVSVADPRIYLAGASGGVYALLAAHLAELLINWSEMEFAIPRAIVLAILIATDAGVALYQRYFVDIVDRVSYVSHLAGFIAGVLMGVLVLRNFRKKRWERVMWWVTLCLTATLALTLVIVNVLIEVL